jgi:peptidoglycan/xylan/chitin deacetylase (PgdA/CDA1 family)
MVKTREFIWELGKRGAGRTSAGLRLLVGRRARGTLGIILYHRVAPLTPGVARPTMNVTPERFRRQFAGLLARGFRVWPLRQVLDHRARGLALPPQTVVVTFDDGFETVYRHAWPVLRALQVPATVFVSTAFLGSRTPFPFDRWGLAHRDRVPGESYRPLTTAQCQEMTRDGLVELGSHTHTHQDFRGRPDELREDMRISVEILRARFGCGDVPFAFPFGRRSLGFAGDALLAAARQAGVTCALTTEAEVVEPCDDPFGWGRFNAYDWDTGATLAGKLAGWYSWAPRVQEWLTGRGCSDGAPTPKPTDGNPWV